MEHYKSNKGAKRPYRVGKGKPPIEHQFKKGQPSPNPRGRPKGSTKASTLQMLLGKVVIANSPDGRRVRKTLGEVIDHKLVEMAAKGDFKAIKLIKEIELKCRQLGLTDRPSAEDLAREAAELEQRRALSTKLIGLLEEEARRKKEKAPRFRPKQPKGDDPEGGQEAA
jgi:hypothetical protein